MLRRCSRAPPRARGLLHNGKEREREKERETYAKKWSENIGVRVSPPRIVGTDCNERLFSARTRRGDSRSRGSRARRAVATKLPLSPCKLRVFLLRSPVCLYRSLTTATRCHVAFVCIRSLARSHVEIRLAVRGRTQRQTRFACSSRYALSVPERDTVVLVGS